jgi:radical SAM superfamily enzyme
MSKYCENCGSKISDGYCTWCHEEIFVEWQYYENGDACPEEIYEKASEHRNNVKKQNYEKYFF